MPGNPELDKLRHEIDVTDNIILDALKRRFELVDNITEVKKRDHMEAHQPGRQAEMMANLMLQAEQRGINPQLAETVWTAIHDEGVRRQEVALRPQEASLGKEDSVI